MNQSEPRPPRRKDGGPSTQSEPRPPRREGGDPSTQGWAAVCLFLSVILAALGLTTEPPASRPAPPPVKVQAAEPTATPVPLGGGGGKEPVVVVSTIPVPSPHPARWIVGTIPGVDAADLETALMRIRGLRFKRVVPAAMQSQAELRRFLTHDPDAEPAQQEWASLRTFGFIPPSFDVTKFKLDLLTSQVGGYYDPRTARFNVVQGNNGLNWFTNGLASLIGYDPTSIVTIHEMDHALTDQYFDIKHIEQGLARLHDDDHALAVQGLLEGDATWVMMDYALQRMPLGMNLEDMPEAQMQMTMEQASTSAANALKTLNGRPVPLVYARLLVFPYFAGLRFIHHLYRLGGWDAVNRAWHDPPETTQQLMHPERYSGTRAFALRLVFPPATPGHGWRPWPDNTLGEFLLGVFFEQNLHEQLVDVTEHWDGDRYRLYHHGRALSLLWMTAWDTPVAAQRFLSAATQVLGPQAAISDRLPGTFRIERRRTRVGLLYGVPADQAASRWRELWAVRGARHPHPVTVHYDPDWVVRGAAHPSLSQMLGTMFGSNSPAHDFVRRGHAWVSPTLHLAVELPQTWSVTTQGLSGSTLLQAYDARPGLMAFLVYSVPSPRIGATLDIGTAAFLAQAHRVGLHHDESHGIPLQIADYDGFATEWQSPAHVRWVVMDRPGLELILGMAWTAERRSEAEAIAGRISHSLRSSGP